MKNLLLAYLLSFVAGVAIGVAGLHFFVSEGITQQGIVKVLITVISIVVMMHVFERHHRN